MNINLWNEEIDIVCRRHRIYPKLIKLNDGRYTFHEDLWKAFYGICNKDPRQITEEQLLRLLTVTKKPVVSNELNQLIDKINKEMEKDKMEATQKKFVTFDEVFETFKNELTHNSFYESTKEGYYKEVLNELAVEMTKQMKLVYNTNVDLSTVHILAIPQEYIQNILIPEAITVISKKKPNSTAYREAKLKFEDKYLKIVIEKLEDLPLTSDIVKEMKYNGKVYVIKSVRYKYVPAYLSNQVIYRDQFIDSYGIHYDTSEITQLIENLRYPKETAPNHVICNTLRYIQDEMNDIRKEIKSTVKDMQVVMNDMKQDIQTLWEKKETTNNNWKVEFKDFNKDNENTTDLLTTIVNTPKEQIIDRKDENIDNLDMIEEYLKDKEDLRNRQFEKKISEEFDSCYTSVIPDILKGVRKNYGDKLSGIKVKVERIQDSNNPERFTQNNKVWIPNVDKLLRDISRAYDKIEITNYNGFEHTYMSVTDEKGTKRTYTGKTITNCIMVLLSVKKLPDKYLKEIMN